MPLYAGVCEANITPPPDGWMGGYAGRGRAIGVQDELFARALVLDNGQKRIALVVADLIAFDDAAATAVRQNIAQALGTEAGGVMLHCTHTHGGPLTYPYIGMGDRDEAYDNILARKLVGVARQAAMNLQPAHLTYGESSAQIGVNRRETRTDGQVIIGHNYGGPVSSLVQTLCINGADGRTFGLLFSHACHPTTMGGSNRHVTADWPGAAVARLKERFRAESAETGIAADALPFFLQGCCGDINPLRRGTWADVQHNGRIIADAAHTARWNAHGRLGETLDYAETTAALPLLPPLSYEECLRLSSEAEQAMNRTEQDGDEIGFMQAAARALQAGELRTLACDPNPTLVQPFSIQKLSLGGATLLGFPAEMFVQYQLDFTSQVSTPLFCLGYTNGCWGYLPTTAEHERGGYEVDEAYKYYGLLNFAPDCEPVLRQTVQTLLNPEDN